MSDVRKWLFILSGFRQHRGASSNGCVDLMSRLSSIYGCGTNRVELDTWHASSRDTAAYVCHLGIKDEPPIVAIFLFRRYFFTHEAFRYRTTAAWLPSSLLAPHK